MRDDEYYKAIAKVAEDWRRQNAFTLQKIARMDKTIQPAYIRMLKDLESSMVGFKGMQEQVRALSDSIRPIKSALEQNILKANLQMSAVLVSLKRYQDIAKQLQEDRRRWGESLRASIGALFQPVDIATALRRDFSLMMSSTLFAHQSVARMNFRAIGEATNIAHHLRAALYQPLIEMANSYRHLWDTFRINFQRVFSVPLVVIKAPSTEMYLAAHQAVASTKEAEVSPEEEEFLAEIEPSKQYMCELISSVDVKLLPLYQGAIDAIASRNIDKVRHATTSLRELFTHILHKLTPDEAFFEWNREESNLSNGRPTRKGRLMYICRNINYGAFITFVERDILAAVAFLDLLQKGTHAIQKPYDDRQLKALLIRMENLLNLIIRISRGV